MGEWTSSTLTTDTLAPSQFESRSKPLTSLTSVTEKWFGPKINMFNSFWNHPTGTYSQDPYSPSWSVMVLKDGSFEKDNDYDGDEE